MQLELVVSSIYDPPGGELRQSLALFGLNG